MISSGEEAAAEVDAMSVVGLLWSVGGDGEVCEEGYAPWPVGGPSWVGV
jgi:hypothetical protein